MNNVVSLAQHRKTKGQDSVILCTQCGSGWWIVAAVCIEQDGRVSGWTGIPQCRECGHFQRVGI